MVDLGSLVLLMSIFGAKVAVVYVLLGLLIAVVGGTLLKRMGMERYVEPFILQVGNVETEGETLTRRDRVSRVWEQVRATMKKVGPYGLIGVGTGGVIHNVIPQDWIEGLIMLKRAVKFQLLAAFTAICTVGLFWWDFSSMGSRGYFWEKYRGEL